MRRLAIISVKIPDSYVKILDELVEKGIFKNRSEAIREALRLLINKYGNQS